MMWVSCVCGGGGLVAHVLHVYYIVLVIADHEMGQPRFDQRHKPWSYYTLALNN